jgi:succinate dehydrogenase/fumarate reductase flavoprotein subunit
MRENYLRGPIFGGCAVPTNEGDLVNIAIDTGVDLGNMNNAWWAQIPVEQALANTSTPSDIFAVPGDSMIQVNRYGRRVVNEKIQYNERTQAHFVWDPVVGEYPNRVLFMIFDQRAIDIFGGSYPIPGAGIDVPYLISGETWDDLTAAIAARLEDLAAEMGPIELDEGFAETLAETVTRFNGYAETGADDEFHRGENLIELAFNGPAREGNDFPNATMYPFGDGPYYCVLVGGGTLDTKGGPKVNAKAQMLTTKGEPVPGLYGAGNCISSPAGQAYWAGGGTIGPALAFGYIAAMNATKESEKSA